MWDSNPSISVQRKCARHYTTWPIKIEAPNGYDPFSWGYKAHILPNELRSLINTIVVYTSDFFLPQKLHMNDQLIC